MDARGLVAATLFILVFANTVGALSVSIDTGRVYWNDAAYMADIYVNAKGSGAATLVWYANGKEVNEYAVKLPYSGKTTVMLGMGEQPVDIYAEIRSGNEVNCSNVAHYEYNQDYPYNNGWRVEIVRKRPCHAASAPRKGKKAETPAAIITVRDCGIETINGRPVHIVGGACREYDVNVTPDSIEYNLVVSFAEGSTKTFAGRGDQRFTVRWSIHAPVPNPEGVPSISNPPVCAKVIYRGEVLASTCGNEAPAKKGENEGAEWKVSVKSPYPYSYRFRGNVLLLDINVNYTARNACYSVYAVVTPIRCPNCYDVYIRERRPAPGEMCAQVIRQIPVVTAKIGPLSRATKSVYVVVHGMNGIMPEQNTIYGRVKCAVIEKELANLKKMLEQCRVSRNCSEKEILQELREKEAELWSECNYKPKPTTPPIAPKPIIINPILPVPPRFKVVLSTVPVNVVKRDNSVVIEGKEASAKVLSTLIVSDGKLIDKSSGITINVAPDSVAKKIRKKTGGEIEAMALENIGGKPTYVVRVKRRIRVWVFTIDIPEKAVIDASSGAVITVEKPWYAGILRIFGWQ